MNDDLVWIKALNLPPSERHAFLSDQCQGDPERLARFLGLLKASNGDRLWNSGDNSNPTLDFHPGNPGDPVTRDFQPFNSPSSQSKESGIGTPRLNDQPDSQQLLGGRYQLLEKIGEGGMGEVWIALQTEPVKRKVALKLIKKGLDSSSVLQRFDQERQALALMDHPNIAKVLDGGITPHGLPFFVMEFVNGAPLTQFCDDSRLTPEARLRIFVLICQAVQHAHQKGIIHRDLKPANILVTLVDGQPVPKVIDFGVAKAVSGKIIEETVATQWGAVIGTLEYMSPEQAGVNGEDVDTRSDIYSLGVILYELLTGLRPIDSSRLRKAALTEMIRIIREEDPARPSTRLSTDEGFPSKAALRGIEPRKLMSILSGELDWIVLKCLEKSRDRRYQTANGLSRDISRYLANEPVEARPPSVTYKLGKFIRRYRGPVAAACLLVFALILGVMGTTLGMIEANRQTEIANNETIQKDNALKGESEQKEVAKKNAELANNNFLLAQKRLEESQYTSSLDKVLLAQSFFESGNVSLAKDTLLQVDPIHRKWEWYYLRQRFEGGFLTLLGHSEPILDVAFHPQGNRVVSCGWDGHAMVWNSTTGERLLDLVGLPKTLYSCNFSQDGQLLALGGEGPTRLWDSQTGKLVRELPGPSSGVRQLRFQPGDKHLLTGHRDGRLRIWNVTNGELVRTMEGHHSDVKSLFGTATFMAGFLGVAPEAMVQVDWSPDGKKILSSCLMTAKVWNAQTGTPEFEVTGHQVALGDSKFTPDGRSIVTLGGDKILKFWNSQTGNLEREFRTDQVLGKMAISPDGTLLAGSFNQGITLIDLKRGGLVRNLRGHTGPVNCLAFHPEGDVLVTGAQERSVKLWSLPLGFPEKRLDGFDVTPSSIAFSKESSLAVTGHRDGGINAWDTDSATRTLHIPQKGVLAVALEKGNQRIASGGLDQTLTLWEKATGKKLKTISGHKGPILNLAFSRNQGKLLSASADQTARLIDLTTGNTEKLFPHKGPCLWIAEDPDGEVLATSDANPEGPSIRIWRQSDGSLKREIRVEGAREFSHLVFGPDGRSLFASNRNRNAYLFDVLTGEILHRLEGHQDILSGLASSPDGSRLVTNGAHEDRTTRIWDTRTGRPLLIIDGYETTPGSLAFGQSGKTLGSVDWGGGVRLFEGTKVTEPRVIRPSPSPIYGAVWRSDGKQLATCGADGVIRVWNPWEGTLVAQKQLRGGALSVCFHPDGSEIAVSTSPDLDSGVREIQFLDGNTLDLKRKISPLKYEITGVQGVGYSQDGTRLVVKWNQPGNGVAVLSAINGKTIQEEPFVAPGLTSISPDKTECLQIDGTKLIIHSLSDPKHPEKGFIPKQNIRYHLEALVNALKDQNVFATQFHEKVLGRYPLEWASWKQKELRKNIQDASRWLSMGRFEEAQFCLMIALGIDPKHPQALLMEKSLAKQLQDNRWKKYRSKEYTPLTAQDALELARSAQREGNALTALQLYRTGFSRNPPGMLVEEKGYRIEAILSAIQIGFSLGKEEDLPTDTETRKSARKQGMEWLELELEVIERARKEPTSESARPNQRFQVLLNDPLLVGARNAMQKMAFDTQEKLSWEILWKKIDQLNKIK